MKNYGFFNQNTFVITDRDTPRHWYNYLYNDDYICFVSQVGFGQGFAQDNMGRRIEFVDDRAVYIVEGDKFWQANGLPIYDELADYACTHGIGYTDIMLKKNGIKSNCKLFVPNKGEMEILKVSVKNESEKTRSLKVIPYYATAIDGRYVPQGYQTTSAHFLKEKNGVYGVAWTKFGSGKIHKAYAYLTATKTISGFDTRQTSFIGTYGNKNEPKALIKNHGLTNTDCIAEKICFALQNEITLQPEECCDFYYIVGVEDQIEDIPTLTENEIEKMFEDMVSYHKNVNDKVYIKTPWPDLNGLFNDWLKYQTTLGSRWARVRHNGFRDINIDNECLSCFEPELAFERFKRILTYQYENGYAPRTFIDGEIRDRNFSDNTVWLTFTGYAIIKELGKPELLNTPVKFNNGKVASIYDHLKNSVNFLWNFTGYDGLVKIWGGDWNDCMDNVGINGKGVSIWLSIAFVCAAKKLSELAKLLGNNEDAKTFAENALTMQQRVNKFGWDSDHYIYAISDDRIPVGAYENEQSKIYATPQLWCVLADFDKEHSITAMDTLERELNTDLGLLISKPPFSKYFDHVGAVCAKYPGLHENGGVYLQASEWKLAADCLLKRNDKVEEGLHKILPTDHKYFPTCGEPYAMYNSYLGEQTGYRYGTPGQSWRTASGQWLLYALVRYIFGLQPEIEGLLINPCLPPEWKDCQINKNFRGCLYNIHYVQKGDGACNKIEKLFVNGKEVDGAKPIKPIAGETFNIEVVLVN